MIFRSKALIGACLFGLALSSGAFGAQRTTGQQSSFSHKYFANAQQLVNQAGAKEFLPFYVVLSDQASRAEVDRASGPNDPDVRHAQVMALLRGVAERSQAPVLSLLRTQQAAGSIRNIQALWIVNVIAAEGTPDAIRTLVARNDIQQVAIDIKRDISIKPVVVEPAGDVFGQAPTCGLNLIQAPQVWSQLGIRGVGSVVANIDTGVCRTHADIRNRIWSNPGEIPGNGIDDDGNGFIDDTWGWNFGGNNNNPNDNNGHGSHTAGTHSGDGTNGTHCGVAPMSEVMVVRSSLLLSSEAEIWNCQQYAGMMKARTTSCSWGWRYEWNPNRVMHRNVAMNLIALGTAHVIAAGNEGNSYPPHNNVRTPGDVPEVITVGSVNCSDNISGFSSRGPVTWQGVQGFGDWPYPPGLIKPDVSAEGDGTVSHSLCSGYVTFSGTSMATPHVAGTVALMCEANQWLRPMQIKEILRTTAVDRGAQGPDNSYGWGRINALAAVNEAIAQRNRHYPESYAIIRGVRTSRDWLSDCHMDDDTYHVIRANNPVSLQTASSEVEYRAVSRTQSPTSISVSVEIGASGAGVAGRIQLFDYIAQGWVTIDERAIGTADGKYTVTLSSNAARFVENGTRNTRARMGFMDRGAPTAAWSGRVDSFFWNIVP